MNKKLILPGIFFGFVILSLFFPSVVEAARPAKDFQMVLENIRVQLTGLILPVVSVIGLVLAAISWISGSPNARAHITYALIGAAIGFGSQTIINFIERLVS